MATKLCIACKEEIKQDALKCRYCKQIQNKAANLHNRPAFNYFAIGLLGILLLWLIYFIVSFSIEDPLEPVFEISESRLLLSESDKGLNIRCIASITNPSIKRWEYFSLQATFHNTKGETIDVAYSKPEINIYPSFHFEGIVAGLGNAEKNEYASCKLSVIDADYY
ncbi:MAG: hypothetical protein ACRBBR_14940 [Cellvibrionaceae bacterium]